MSLWTCENEHTFTYSKKPDECPMCSSTNIEAHLEKKLNELIERMEKKVF